LVAANGGHGAQVAVLVGLLCLPLLHPCKIARQVPCLIDGHIGHLRMPLGILWGLHIGYVSYRKYILKTNNLIIAVNPDTIAWTFSLPGQSFNLITCYPGSPYHCLCLKTGA